MSIELRVKAASLAAEARIIKAEERRLKRRKHWPNETLHLQHFNLRQHRILIVRAEARATHLARGYLKGLPYERMEQRARNPVPAARIRAMLTKYGSKEQLDGFAVWLAIAADHWKRTEFPKAA